MIKIPKIIILLLFPVLLLNSQSKNSEPIGIFESSTDIGSVGLTGSTKYDKEDMSYLVKGAGENMWFGEDAFHYVWRKATGDVSISTNLYWIGEGKNPHRKAGIVIRQNLSPGSPYIDAIVHGDGLTSMQYREFENDLTREIQSNYKAPSAIKLEKKGNYYLMSVAYEDKMFVRSGGSIRVKIDEPFYIGIGLCSHDSTFAEEAVFSNIKINENNNVTGGREMLESTIETINIESMNRRVVLTQNKHMEAPNWSADGSYLIYNSNGLLYKLNIETGIPELINTDFANSINNDHGLSPDNKFIVISDQSEEDNKSRIYTLPVDGGIPKLITENAPSYWHGWSPDGNTLTYCAERNGQYDIYSIPAIGGQEIQLTDTKGLDDGPEYSHDGKYIFFNSVRSGKMEIWRMNNDGSDQIQITDDEYNNWFPHPSPDGQWLVFLSYEKDVVGHPANKDVSIRIMPLQGGEVKVLTNLFGGQGTINVPSWSPDSKNIAFVSYWLQNE